MHRVHSCTVHSTRERASLILAELRHRTAQGAAETCGQRAHRRLLLGALLHNCIQEGHPLSADYRLPERDMGYHLKIKSSGGTTYILNIVQYNLSIAI